MESILISLIVSFLIALLVRMYFNEETKLNNESTKKKLSKKLNESNKLFRRPLRPKDGKIKIALLTNELPPIVYGGVSTWILNFMKMFKDNPKVEVIPFFLAHIDNPHPSFEKNYPGLRILYKDTIVKDIKN